MIVGIISLMIFSWIVGFGMGSLGTNTPDEPVTVPEASLGPERLIAPILE